MPDLIQYSPSITETRATAGLAGSLYWRWRRPAQPILAPPATPPRSSANLVTSMLNLLHPHMFVSLWDCIFSCSSSSWNHDVSELVCLCISHNLKINCKNDVGFFTACMRKAQIHLFSLHYGHLVTHPSTCTQHCAKLTVWQTCIITLEPLK